MTHSRKLLLMAAASTLLLALVTCRVPQSLFSDPAYQLDALQEYLEGNSQSINQTFKPKASDISQNESSWIIWWPPGTQIVAYPFVKMGMPFGTALRTIALLFLLLGACGWALWIRLFDLPVRIQYVLIALLPWIRYSSNSIFIYSAEILAFGTGPWVLLCVHAVARWRLSGKNIRWPMAAGLFVLGIALGFRYILKYSALFSSVGALAFLMWNWRARWKEYAARLGAVFVSGGFALPVVALSVLNQHYTSAANGVMKTAGWSPKWQSLLALMSSPALALADADAWIRFLVLHPDHGWLQQDAAMLWCGFPGGLLMAWLLLRRRPNRECEWMTLWVMAMSGLGLMLVWNFAQVADFSARHIATAAMMSLPWVIQQGLQQWRETKNYGIRAVLVLGGLLYVGIPMVYGVISVPAKVLRYPSPITLGPTRIYNPHITTTDFESVSRWLLKDYDPDHDVWYLPEPLCAIQLPGRAIVRHVDFLPLVTLKKDCFMTSSPMRVRALMPIEFESNGKAETIRQSFPQASHWIRRVIPECRYVLWESMLNATSDHR